MDHQAPQCVDKHAIAEANVTSWAKSIAGGIQPRHGVIMSLCRLLTTLSASEIPNTVSGVVIGSFHGAGFFITLHPDAVFHLQVLPSRSTKSLHLLRVGGHLRGAGGGWVVILGHLRGRPGGNEETKLGSVLISFEHIRSRHVESSCLHGV